MRAFWRRWFPPRDEKWSTPPRYRRLWWYTVVLTLLVAAAPLLALAWLNLEQHEKNLQAQIRQEITRTLATTSRSLEVVLGERLAALDLLSREHTFEELSAREDLHESFQNLRHSFRGSTSGAYGGFVDLGLVDQTGELVCYVGPYDLRGVNYRDQEWFHEVVLRGSHISDVFLGYRKTPHLVITVKRETSTDRFHMLRVTLDTELLTQLLSVSGRGRTSDIFLVNRAGILQTPSYGHGRVLEPCSLPVPAYSTEMEVIDDFHENGQSYVLGYSYIRPSPFILIVLRKRTDLSAELDPIRTEVFWFLTMGLALILLVVLGSATVMIRRIRLADRRRIEVLHQMEYTNKMATIGRLAASVAHEINNPLAIINEKAGLMQDLVSVDEEFPHRDKALASLGSIIQSVERCGAVTHRLLGFTRRLESRKERIDLASLLQEVMGFLTREALHRNIRIITDFPDDVPTIEADRGQLQQVFLNILNNALAAVEDEGRIDVTLRPHGEARVAVSIRDDGVGISEEHMAHLFEPFFSTKGEFGTGLGLSITQNLVRGLGGDISVDSAPGQGTCFTVELPLGG